MPWALSSHIQIKCNNIIFLLTTFQVYVGALSLHYEALSVEASKQTTAEEIVSCIVERLSLPVSDVHFRCILQFPINLFIYICILNREFIKFYH